MGFERPAVASLVCGFTIDAAFQIRVGDEIGSLEVGKKADLIVLDQDILVVNAYATPKTQVMLTMLDGEIVYEATSE